MSDTGTISVTNNGDIANVDKDFDLSDIPASSEGMVDFDFDIMSESDNGDVDVDNHNNNIFSNVETHVVLQYVFVQLFIIIRSQT